MMDPTLLPSVLKEVEEILQQHPAGLSEYQLLIKLRASNCLPLEMFATGTPLDLFRQHFILFHVLYQLRDDYWRTRRAQLDISPLNIILLPYIPATAALSKSDAVRDYYLDLENLQQTGEEEVLNLLSRFWMQMNGGAEREAALRTLGLDQDADFSAIKLRYRQRVMQHHPDRGGDTEQLQNLNAAMEWLAKYHK